MTSFGNSDKGGRRSLCELARPSGPRLGAVRRLSWDGSDQPVRDRLTKPLPTGQTGLTLTPLELLDRLAALMPPPRRHRHHDAGVFAPRARDPPELDAGFAFAFDQSPSWTAPPPDPGCNFDQTLA